MRKFTGRTRVIEEKDCFCDYCNKKVDDEDDFVFWDTTYTSYDEDYGIVIEVCSLDCLVKYFKNIGHNAFIPESHMSIYLPREEGKNLFYLLKNLS